MKNEKLKNLILSSMFVALGLVLPFLTGQIQQIGNKVLPMHLPIMLCGLVCGGGYGLAVGLIVPVLRSMLFSMPVMYPNAIAMSFELATYGFVAGFLYSRSKWKCIISLYRALIASMLAGRAVFGIAQTVLLGISGKSYTLEMFIGASFLNAIPGIILQLILIPAIMVALHRAKLVHFSKKGKKTNA